MPAERVALEAFAAADSFMLLCPYGASALPDEVIAEARRSHRPTPTRSG
ncbi:MAG TPA: hypothetical protein VK287_08020 [Gaiellaceae bacterium]|nr:hypothetical protein [Gaiellaceae bacterium]